MITFGRCMLKHTKVFKISFFMTCVVNAMCLEFLDFPSSLYYHNSSLDERKFKIL